MSQQTPWTTVLIAEGELEVFDKEIRNKLNINTQWSRNAEKKLNLIFEQFLMIYRYLHLCFNPHGQKSKIIIKTTNVHQKLG